MQPIFLSDFHLRSITVKGIIADYQAAQNIRFGIQVKWLEMRSREDFEKPFIPCIFVLLIRFEKVPYSCTDFRKFGGWMILGKNFNSRNSDGDHDGTERINKLAPFYIIRGTLRSVMAITAGLSDTNQPLIKRTGESFLMRP